MSEPKNKAAVYLGRKGGKAGTGSSKKRSEEHYARIQALARAKRAESLLTDKPLTEQAVAQ